MATISLTLPVSGTVITAGLHSTNYTTIQNVINGGLDNNNWAAGKIFGIDKLMQNSAVDGDGIAWDNAATLWKRTTDKSLRLGAIAAPVSGIPAAAVALPVVYDRVTTAVDVASTLTETNLYSKSIVGGDMGTNRMLRLRMRGDYLHNNVAGDTITLRIKFGGTTFYADASALAGVTGANRQPWTMLVEIANLGTTNSQHIGADFNAPIPSAAAPTTGIGPLRVSDASNSVTVGISTPGTIDTTSAQTFAVSAQWSASSANNSFRMRYAELALV